MSIKKLSVIAILSAMAIISNILIRFPIIPSVSFLCYDPKDIVIVIAGFIYNPLVCLIMSAVCSIIELMYRGGTYIDVIMNMISTCAFACTASLIYRRFRTKKGAVVGLLMGIFLSVDCMLVWNYLVTPGYYELPRSVVVDMMFPGILPFNAIKCGINAAVVLVLYKPIVTIFRSTSLLESSNKRVSFSKAFLVAGIFLLVTLVLVILVINGVIK